MSVANKWNIKSLTDSGWALASDPWEDLDHWLPPRWKSLSGPREGKVIDQIYSFTSVNLFAAASMIMVDDLRREALEFLKRAIACEPEKYRDLASQEQDFDLLRDDPQYGAQFRELVSTR